MGKAGSPRRRKAFRDRAAPYFEQSGLAKGTRHLVDVAMLTLGGDAEDLLDGIDWALSRHVPINRVRETILQTYLFAGFPRALFAFEVLDESTGGRAAPQETDRLPPRTAPQVFFQRRGRVLFEEIYRDDADTVVRRIRGFHPEFMDWILNDAYGKVLSRPFLDVKTREILSAALLTGLSLPRQLTSHMRGALRAGATRRELGEMIRQLELFVPASARAVAERSLARAIETV